MPSTQKLSSQQIERFKRDGVIIAEGILDDDDLGPVIAEINAFVDRRARLLHDAGQISDLYEDEPFEHRLVALQKQCDQIHNGLDIMQMRGRATFAFLHNRKLLDAVECLVGPEISCSPIQHLRGKVPTSQDVPWHQDAGVCWAESDQSQIVTCWIPLVDARRENGCMEVLPGVHRRGYLEHIGNGGTRIRPDLLPPVSPLCAECPKGGGVFLTQFTPHHGLPNQTTDQVRWSLDLRYQKTGTPTGRPFQPDFVVRCGESNNVMNDYDQWCRMWEEALRKPHPPTHRPARQKQLAGEIATLKQQGNG